MASGKPLSLSERSGWAVLRGPEAKKWAALWSTAWRTALRATLPAGKEAIRRAVTRAVGGQSVNLSAFWEALRPGARFSSTNLDAALKVLQQSKLRLSVLYWNGKPTILLHKQIPKAPEYDATYGLKLQSDPVSWKPVKVPYLSHYLEDATGFDWMVEPGALDQHEAARMFRAARLASQDENVRAIAEKVSGAGTPLLKVQPHFPVRLPQFGTIHQGFRAGRPAGWAAIGANAVDILSVVSFASFLKGNNPGFLASVLWKSPIVAIPFGLVINAIVGRHKRKEMREKIQAARAQAEAAYAAEVERIRKSVEESLAARRADVVRKRYQAARVMQQVRYGLAGLVGR